MESVIPYLLQSTEPSIRYKTRVNILGESPDSASIKKLNEEIRMSPRVLALLGVRHD